MSWLERLGIAKYRDRKIDQLSGGSRSATAAVAPPARQAASQVASAPAPQAAPVAPAAASANGAAASGSPADGRPIYLQIAALGSAESAQALQARLQAELSRPVRVDTSTGVHRVQVGPLASADQVEPDCSAGKNFCSP